MKTNCGIYKITNLKNNKVYIGSSSNLKSRKYQHFNNLKNNKHINKYLQSSYNKYGKENFKWEILEYINKIENVEELKNILIDRENLHLNNHRDKDVHLYNLRDKADSNLGIVKPPVTKETRDKLSKLHKGKKLSEETKKKISNFNKNREHTLKERINRSKSLRGRIKSKEECINISKSRVRKKVINLDTGEIFNSIKEASDFYKTQNIIYVCKGRRKTAGGHGWSYYNEKTFDRDSLIREIENKFKIKKNNQYEKISGKNKKKVINLDTGEIFNSVKEVYEKFSIRLGSVLKGTSKTAGGYRWDYYS